MIAKGTQVKIVGNSLKIGSQENRETKRPYVGRTGIVTEAKNGFGATCNYYWIDFGDGKESPSFTDLDVERA